MDNPNLDDDYDSKYERLASSKESPNLRAQLDTRWAQREQQTENWPPIRAPLEEKCLTQIQAQINWLLAERRIPDLIREVLLETQSLFPTSISTTIPLKNFKMLIIPLCDGKTDSVTHV